MMFLTRPLTSEKVLGPRGPAEGLSPRVGEDRAARPERAKRCPGERRSPSQGGRRPAGASHRGPSRSLQM